MNLVGSKWNFPNWTVNLGMAKGFLSSLQSPTSRCCSWLWSCRHPWHAERAELFYGQKNGTWRFPCSPILYSRGCLLRVFLAELLLAGFGTRNSIFVDVHDQELVELDVFMSLQGSALVWPAQPLQVDAQTLRQLQERKIHIFHGKKQLVSPGNKEMHFPYLCVSSVSLKCDNNSCDIPGIS